MTGRKSSADDAERFEDRAIAELEKLSTNTWQDMVALLRPLPKLPPSAQRRILVHMIELAAKRGDPLSVKLVKRLNLNRLLDVPPRRRGRVHDQEAFRKAAEYQAANPRASWGELAKAADVSRERVRQWKQSAAFQRLVREFQVRNDINRAPEDRVLWKCNETLTREANEEFKRDAEALKSRRRRSKDPVYPK
jgi:hypothetical protein